jgi:hypothetical protein
MSRAVYFLLLSIVFVKKRIFKEYRRYVFTYLWRENLYIAKVYLL